MSETTDAAKPRWLRAATTDATEFLTFVDALIGSGARDVSEVFVIRVDNWFGPKWLGFAAKVHGALPVRRRPGAAPVVPPFTPSRIVSERRLCRSQGGFEKGGFEEHAFTEQPVHGSIHRAQTSADNLDRRLNDIAEDALFVWFSGKSSANGRGSVLVAATPGEQGDVWYASVAQAVAAWRLVTSAGPVPSHLGEWMTHC